MKLDPSSLRWITVTAFAVASVIAYAQRYPAGDTYEDMQHYGTVGRMIGVDDAGTVHVVWTKAPMGPPRSHVYYNCWNPDDERFAWPGGFSVEAGPGAGNARLTLMESGWCFPAFTSLSSIPPYYAYPAVAMDQTRCAAAFTVSGESEEIELRQPNIAVGRDSSLHMVAFAYDLVTPYYVLHYLRAIPRWDADGYGLGAEFEMVDTVGGVPVVYRVLDTTTVSAADVACSPVSDRVVIAYPRPRVNPGDPAPPVQIDNDLFLLFSEDGGHNWGTPTNVTDFEPPDVDCASGDSMICNRDTLRVYSDCSALVDFDDHVHVAFTTRTYYYFLNGQVGPFSNLGQSGIWHWSEPYEEFTPIINHYSFFDDDGPADPGCMQLYVQRPSLAQDPVTHYLYCAYQRFMPEQWSDLLYRMSDIFLSVSCNNGRVWSEAVNATRTNGGINTPPPGSLSEREPSLADHVSYDDGVGYLHLFYLLDRDAGTYACNEGVAVLCTLFYHRVPVESVPLQPVVNPFWPSLRVDSTGFTSLTPADTVGDHLCALDSPDSPRREVPLAVQLHPNYPNPFNSATEILFDLDRDARVTLEIYNVLGQPVERIYSDTPLLAGPHRVRFDARRLTSGIYFCRFAAHDVVRVRKMVLLR